MLKQKQYINSVFEPNITEEEAYYCFLERGLIKDDKNYFIIYDRDSGTYDLYEIKGEI